MIKSPNKSDLFLHHNFVCALLNDLFGIQARGGCACSGPYAQHLMGMNNVLAKEYEALLLEDNRLDRTHLRRGYQECSQYEFLRPGFSRLNLPWFATNEEIEYIYEALNFVADYGWKFMPQYIFNHETGEWKHHTNQVFKERKWLGNFDFKGGQVSFNHTKNEEISDTFKDIMSKAHELLKDMTKMAMKMQIPDQSLLFQDPKAAKLRWILLPSDVKLILNSKQMTLKITAPFIPIVYPIIQNSVKSVGSYKGIIDDTLILPSQINMQEGKSSWLNIKMDSSKKEIIKKETF